jgi:hypothetical protein
MVSIDPHWLGNAGFRRLFIEELGGHPRDAPNEMGHGAAPGRGLQAEMGSASWTATASSRCQPLVEVDVGARDRVVGVKLAHQRRE